MEPRQAAIETYRYLRVGIVGLAVLLGVSVAGEIVLGDTGLLDSISDYYYTPVRDVFVGVLFALGLGLVVVRGRGVEDVLLNLAGMLAPVIAVVPTSATLGWFAYAPLAESEPSVVQPPFLGSNGAWSLIVIGIVGLGVAAFTAGRLDGAARRRATGGIAAAATLLLGFALWLAIDSGSFGRAAHYVAAVGLFGIFVVVARLNARSARDADEGPVMAAWPAARRRAAYSAISWSMLGTVVVGGLLGLLELAGSTPIPHWLFWVEAILLTLFAGFWVLQTIEYWHDGVPVDAD